MKDFNTKHEAIIESRLIVNDTNPKGGQVYLHNNVVDSAYFFQPNYVDNAILSYTKVWLSKELILDLAEQIQQIEKRTIETEYFPPLPF